MKIDFTGLAKKQKELEDIYDYRLVPGSWTIFRLDGRCFSALTSFINDAFSKSFQECMINVTKALLKEFKADLAFVGSDEISLAFSSIREFDCRVEKYLSLLSGFCSVEFYKEVLKHEDLTPIASKTPHFDCRVFQCNFEDTINYFALRKASVVRNAERTLLRHSISHCKLQNHSNEWGFKELWKADPSQIHYLDEHQEYLGTFICIKEAKVNLTQEELDKIPERYRPNGPVTRKVHVELSEDDAYRHLYNVWILNNKNLRENFELKINTEVNNVR